MVNEDLLGHLDRANKSNIQHIHNLEEKSLTIHNLVGYQ